MKLEAIHDILTNGKSYAQKAIELMLTDPKIIGDWMEKYKEGGEEAITDTHSREAYIDYTDHGRPDTHKVPHTHIIEIGTIIDRKKGAKTHEY